MLSFPCVSGILASNILLLLLLLSTTFSSAEVLNIANVTRLFASGSCPDCHRFDGIGGISGGGATSRLLVDYPEDEQSEILDFLFLPNFGASLHLLKVEIGGDSQSTDGSESSHMHSKDDLNFQRGYEWWLLKEAKKRNPNILTYGLPWAFPGWISEDKRNPFKHMDRVANYTLQWVRGARQVHGIDIDYLGIWNEVGTNREYLLTLRKILDDNGFKNIKLVSNDGQARDLCPNLVNDTEYVENIDVLGFHYPADNQPPMWKMCNSFQTPIWASEESSSYNDHNGAGCWARVMASHYVLNNMTANIMWNLVGSYMHGTNWYAASMLTAVQPWSGYYEWEQMPVVWATAHYTQFIQPGWHFLPVGQGSGELKKGGYYMTLVSPDLQYFTVIAVKISRDHAACTRPQLWDWDTEDEVFDLTINLPLETVEATNGNSDVQTWYSNLESAAATLFERLDPDGETDRLKASTTTQLSPGVVSFQISLNISVGSVYTVTNQGQKVGRKGQAKMRRKPDALFPLPYYDDFASYDCVNCYPTYLSDQMGAFEIQYIDDEQNDEFTATDKDTSLKTALVQMTPEIPVAWFGGVNHGPVSLIGMTEWEDIHVEVSFRSPDGASCACISTRTDQHWGRGISFCVNSTQWHLVYGGGKLKGFDPADIIEQGNITTNISIKRKVHKMSLITVGNEVKATFDDVLVTKGGTDIRSGDSGFVAIGTNAFVAVEFGHIRIEKAGTGRWDNPSPLLLDETLPWSVTLRECTPNGLSSDSERFNLTANWQIRHVLTGLCVTVDDTSDSIGSQSSLTLAECKHDFAPQQFRHDYTQIRNGVNLKTLTNEKGDLCATRNGQVSLTNSTHASSSQEATCAGADDAFTKWTLYPNTQQLRNSFGYNSWLKGRAQCLYAEQVTSLID